MNSASQESPHRVVRFPSTRWSVVLRAGEGLTGDGAALNDLCRAYWYPIYSYIRRHGYPHHLAEECTQDFLARLATNGSMGRACPGRGRFRAWLLTSLRNFLASQWHRDHAAKRGGGVPTVPVGAAGPGLAHPFELTDHSLTPEQAFDRNWALGMLDDAMEELRTQYAAKHRSELFAALEPLVWQADDRSNHASLAAPLGMTPHSFTVALQRLRLRFGECLRRRVRLTVARDEDLEGELRYLVAALNGALREDPGQPSAPTISSG